MQHLDDTILDYNVYHLGIWQRLMVMIPSAAVGVFILYLFYGYWIVGIAAIPLSFLMPKIYRNACIKNRKKRLLSQFNEMIYALSGAMQAGKSIEQAFLSIPTDLELLYPEPKTEIMRELRFFSANLNGNISINDLLADFSARTHEEDITSFYDVYRTTKEIGGDIIQVMRTTSETISDKVTVYNEIEVAISSAKFEHKVLMFIPVGVIMMIRTISPGYLDTLYGTLGGIVLSTVSLLMLGAAWFLGNKITDIRV